MHKKLSIQDSGKTFNVAVAEPLRVHLQGNPTTGFTWTRAGFHEPTQLSDENFNVSAEYHPAKTKMVGAGGEYIFTIIPQKAGQHQLVLIYARSFEPSNAADKTFTANLVVK